MVVPCYNESQRFPTQYWEEVVDANSTVFWLFVDDGSHDNTLNVITKLSERTNCGVIRSVSNLGKGNAIRFGFEHGLCLNQNFIHFGYLDSDGAFSTKDVSDLIDLGGKDFSAHNPKPWDILIASRVALAGREINRKKYRHYIGRIIATLVTSQWENSPYDTQSGLKIFRGSEAFRISIQNGFVTKWFFDIELMARIGFEGQSQLVIWEEPVSYWKDIEGSKLNFRSFFVVLHELMKARRSVARLVTLERGQPNTK